MTGEFLYVSNASTSSISAFSINPDTGFLTPVSGSPFSFGGTAFSGISLAATPDGKFLVAANAFERTIIVYSIASDGSLTPASGPQFIERGMVGIKISPNGRYLALAQFNAISLYRIGTDGSLTLATGSPFLLPAGASISSLDINCGSNLLFANRLGPGFVEVLEGRAIPAIVFRIAEDGSLTHAGDAPGIPGFGHNVVSVLLSPDDRFLYLSDSSVSRSIAVYSVAADGALLPVLGSPFLVSGLEPSPEAVPTGIVTNAAGTALFTAIYRNMVGSFNVTSAGQLITAPGSPYSLVNTASEVLSIAAYPAKACQTGPDFDICIQSGDQVLRVNSETGEYQFADCDNVILEGTGKLKSKGCALTLHHNSADRRIQATINTCQNKGSATVQVLSPRRTFTLSDMNIGDGCGCS